MNMPPYEQEAEEAVLGAMMLSHLAIDAVSGSLAATDFYRPMYGHVYDSILRLHARGVVVDPVTVRADLETTVGASVIGDGVALVEMVVGAPSVTAVRHYAEIVLDRSLRRRLMVEGNELAKQAMTLTVDPMDLLQSHQALVATMGSTLIDHEPDDTSIEEFVARPRSNVSPWVIHGLLRRRHKIMIVGGEGAGKSWVLRFMAICAAYGVHPFRHDRIKPIRTLIIDLENPEDALYDSFEMMLKQVASYNPQDKTHARLWWRPAGINLRNRVDVAELENVIRTRRPDLVCLGPLYAAYENTSKDFGWETAAREVQVVLKQLMVRYDFGLMIEDHAPQADSKGKRDMRPYGSSMWRRWPDVGIGMEPVEGNEHSFQLTRWRGDRVPLDWPEFITRGSAMGSPWPFVGTWKDEVAF